MKKNSLPIRSLTAALSVKRSLPAILAAGLLMGSFAQRAQAQATPAQSEETTHNLLDRVVLIKASAAGKVKFTLAPEDPTKVTRDHWPIVFIDYENDGKNIRQMYNLTEDREFEVNVAATQGGVIKITGENGMWNSFPLRKRSKMPPSTPHLPSATSICTTMCSERPTHRVAMLWEQKVIRSKRSISQRTN